MEFSEFSVFWGCRGMSCKDWVVGDAGKRAGGMPALPGRLRSHDMRFHGLRFLCHQNTFCNAPLFVVGAG
jgi:hypothetical protein